MSVEKKIYGITISDRKNCGVNHEVSFQFLCAKCDKRTMAYTTLDHIQERAGYIAEACTPCEFLNIMYLQLKIETTTVLLSEEGFEHL